jgi:hypothetical protein
MVRLNAGLATRRKAIELHLYRSNAACSLGSPFKGSKIGKMPTTSSDERRSPRTKVMLSATLQCGEVQLQVRVDDVSAHGVRVLGDELPTVDTPVIFQCKGLFIHGFVAWVQKPLAGIGFGDAIRTEQVIRNVPQSLGVALPLDSMPKDFRRPGFRGRHLTEDEERIVRQWVTR